MEKIMLCIENTVVYHSIYETEISPGNTSTGRLEVEYFGGCMEQIRSLIKEGNQVYPVVTLKEDLLGRIEREILQQEGCRMDYVRMEEGKTPFIFRLTDRWGNKESWYKFQPEKGDR